MNELLINCIGTVFQAEHNETHLHGINNLKSIVSGDQPSEFLGKSYLLRERERAAISGKAREHNGERETLPYECAAEGL